MSKRRDAASGANPAPLSCTSSRVRGPAARAVTSTVSLLAIVVGSALLGHAMLILQIPQQITATVASLDLPPLMVLMGLFVVLTVLADGIAKERAA